MTPTQIGSLAMVLSMAAFAVEDAFFKQATATLDVGPALIVFGLVGMTLFAALSRARGEPVLHPAMRGRKMLLRSGFELSGRLFFALALAHAPLSATSAILQATPLVVTLGAVLFLGAQVGPRRWMALILGFAGVLLILRPSPDSFAPGALFAVLATLGFAGRDLMTRLSPPDMSVWHLGTLGFGVVVLAGAVQCLASLATTGAPPRLPTGPELALLLLTGGFGALAYGALTRAMRSGDIAAVTPFRYTRLIFAFALAALWFGERPDAAVLAGAALIVGSGLYGMARARDQKPTGSRA